MKSQSSLEFDSTNHKIFIFSTLHKLSKNIISQQDPKRKQKKMQTNEINPEHNNKIGWMTILRDSYTIYII